MTFSLNPMAKARASAEAKIAQYFAPRPTDAAHARKRTIADSVVAGGAVPAEFAEAADVEGMTPAQLAAAIVAKPDELLARDNQRRRIVNAARAAPDPAALAEILSRAGIGQG